MNSIASLRLQVYYSFEGINVSFIQSASVRTGDTMAKTCHVVPLYGVVAGGAVAKTHQANEVEEFRGDIPSKTGYFVVTHPDLGVPLLTTPKGQYCTTVQPKATDNVFKFETTDGIKIQVSLKKVVGTLVYWA